MITLQGGNLHWGHLRESKQFTFRPLAASTEFHQRVKVLSCCKARLSRNVARRCSASAASEASSLPSPYSRLRPRCCEGGFFTSASSLSSTFSFGLSAEGCSCLGAAAALGWAPDARAWAFCFDFPKLNIAAQGDKQC
eukprot:6187709-Pleurochrysis_carterae.AAC.2